MTEAIQRNRAFAQALATAALPEAHLRLDQWKARVDTQGPRAFTTFIAGIDAICAAQMGALVGVLDPEDASLPDARDAALEMAAHVYPALRPDLAVDAFETYNQKLQALPSAPFPVASGPFAEGILMAKQMLESVGSRLDHVLAQAIPAPLKVDGQISFDPAVPLNLQLNEALLREQFTNLQLLGNEALTALKLSHQLLQPQYGSGLSDHPLVRLIGSHGPVLEALVNLPPAQVDLTALPRLRQLVKSMVQGLSLALPRPN